MNTIQTSKTRIAFIGAGNMASSLIGGLLAKGFLAENISASDPFEGSRQKLSGQYGIFTSEDNHRVLEQAEVVVLAVKPQVMKAVVEDLAPNIQQNKPLVISIAAGITVDFLQELLCGDNDTNNSAAIVRCMPNTPALVQQGASGLFANKQVSDEQKILAKNILDAVGVSIWVNTESELDAVTAVSGSGPAYYFLLMEAMIKAGVAQGLTEEVAKQLTLQTALGAATMALQSEDEPGELRRKVTSPNGTTEAAIQSFQKNDFAKIVEEALEAAQKRSVNLAQELAN